MAELKLTAQNFEAEVLQSANPVLVDFWAPWCGPCRMLAPTLAAFAEEHASTLSVGKVNVDEESALASQFGIMSIPALILFKNGTPVAQRAGYCTKAELEAFVSEA